MISVSLPTIAIYVHILLPRYLNRGGANNRLISMLSDARGFGLDLQLLQYFREGLVQGSEAMFPAVCFELIAEPLLNPGRYRDLRGCLLHLFYSLESLE